MTGRTVAQRKSARLPKTESPEAAQAFADYVAMGPGRTLEGLAETYLARTEPVPTRQLSRLKVWSTAFGWQARLTAARNEATERKLEEAAELDAETFLETSRLLNERIGHTSPLQLDAVVKMRESVRKPAPKGGASVDVNVNIDVQVQQLAERIAEREGLDPQEVVAEAERYIAELGAS